MMLDRFTKLGHRWTPVWEPRAPAYAPNSYLLLVSALRGGWRVHQVEMAPSWDQHGFIYLVTLRRGQTDYAQQLILPKNAFIEALLVEMKVF
jgi:hypothetical protein